MKEILFCEQKFVLDPSGLLIWPDQKLAVVSDLHLEKASHFAIKGQMIPPHDSLETLQALTDSLAFSGAKTVIFLGDTFHDAQGFSRMNARAQNLFQSLCQIYDIIFIIGNHDGGFIPEGTKGYEELRIENILFRHEALPNETNEISGHFHPKARLHLKGQKISKPCFVEDGAKMILPAFGVFTGGLNVLDKAIQSLISTPYNVYMLGAKNIYAVPAEKLTA